MKKISRMLCLLLALLMMAATALAEPALTPASGAVKMLVSVTGGKDEEEMVKFAEALSAAVGLEVSMEKPPSDYNQVMMQKLQGGELYDLIYLNVSDYMNLIAQDALTDITDWTKTSPIYSANVEPQELLDITVDGKVYAGFNKKELHRVVALNKTLLSQVGVDYKAIEPTLDGYYEVMKKLKEGVDTQDFYPFNAVISETYDLQPWFATLGLKNGVAVDPADGKTYAPYALDEAAPVWTWLKQLYDEQLLDPGSFVDKTKDMRAKMGAASHLTGICVDWAMWVGLHNQQATAAGVPEAEYEIVSLPGTQTPDGGYMLVKGAASLFAIPANAPNPDGAKRVLEYFATQQGGELLSIGIEGIDWNREGDAVVLTELGATHASDHGAPVPIYKDFVHPVGYNRGVAEALTYVQYASIDRPIPNETDYKNTVGKWGIQMIKGEVGIPEGLEGLRAELVALGVTEK